MGKLQLLLFWKRTGEKPATLPVWEREAKKPLFPGVFDEYAEMVIQYGYITLFAAAFPLAPALAALNNIVSCSPDA
jgi:hypothetical protein